MSEGYKGGLRGAQMFRRRVDQLFEVIDESRPDDDFTGYGNKQLFHMDLKRFRNIDATTYFGFHDDEALIDATSSLDDAGKPKSWPFHYALLSPGKKEEDDGFGEDSIQCNMLRAVPVAQTRGRVRISSSYMVAEDTLVMHRLRGAWRFIAAGMHYALVGRRWVRADWHTPFPGGYKAGKELPFRNITPSSGEVEQVNQRIAIHMGMAELSRTLWHVEIGRSNSLSFAFATVPGRISGVFKARELPPGEKRRAALKNWVTDHWRTDANDPEFEVYVRKHLRGSETFTWGDYFCTVHPAAIDLEAARLAADERALMGEQARRPKAVEKPRIRVKAGSRFVECMP